MANARQSTLFTHERVNTLLAIVGITVALFTAWHQFGPNPDLLNIDDDGRVSVEDRLTVRADFPTQGTNLVGPVVWKVIVYNPLDRAVAVRSVQVYMLNGGRLSYYSDLLSRIGDGTGSAVDFPVNLDPRQAKSFTVFLNIPSRAEAIDNATLCIQTETSLRELERCLFLRGRDLFGNEIEVLFDSTTKEDPIGFTWKGQINSPSFMVIFQTADGSEFSQLIRYYPDFEL